MSLKCILRFYYLCVCVFVGMCPDIGTTDGIAFDWINRRIYYSDYTNQTINSMAEDGSQHAVIAHVTKPRAIVLDPCAGYAKFFLYQISVYLLLKGEGPEITLFS